MTPYWTHLVTIILAFLCGYYWRVDEERRRYKAENAKLRDLAKALLAAINPQEPLYAAYGVEAVNAYNAARAALNGTEGGFIAPADSTEQDTQEKNMKLNPVHDRIVVKRIKADEVTKGGILLPDPEKPDQGEVVAVGPGKLDEGQNRVPMSVKVGDRVLLGKYSGTTVKIDGDELLVMREEDVFAVID